jgi:hypothetical protein
MPLDQDIAKGLNERGFCRARFGRSPITITTVHCLVHDGQERQEEGKEHSYAAAAAVMAALAAAAAAVAAIAALAAAAATAEAWVGVEGIPS